MREQMMNRKVFKTTIQSVGVGVPMFLFHLNLSTDVAA